RARVQQPYIRTPTLQCHPQRLDRQMPVVHGADGPADHEAREQIEDGGEIQFATLPNDVLGGVADLDAEPMEPRNPWNSRVKYLTMASFKAARTRLTQAEHTSEL